jgi:hypothetical protein
MEFPRIPTYGIHPPTAGVSGRELWRCFFFPGVSGELCCAASRRSKEGPRARRASDPQASLQIAISIFLSPHPSPVLAEEQPAAQSALITCSLLLLSARCCLFASSFIFMWLVLFPRTPSYMCVLGTSALTYMLVLITKALISLIAMLFLDGLTHAEVLLAV